MSDPTAHSQPTAADEVELVTALRAGDEQAFRTLVTRYHPALVRVAEQFVSSRAVAEEVAQDTWLAVLEGVDRFEGRSSIRTWIFRLLRNIAQTRGARDGRVLPFAAFGEEASSEQPLLHPDRFATTGVAAGHWASPVRPWTLGADEIVESAEAMALVRAAIDRLPPGQRQVVTMRDVEGFGSEEVCNVLGISQVNQRVLLHRARNAVRLALEDRLTR